MQTATALVALAGDRGNTVPKIVTPAEILVLQAIHGDGAVFDIDPKDAEIERSSREELSRLARAYPARDPDGRVIVQTLFPTAGAVPSTWEDIERPEDADGLGTTPDMFIADTRKTPKKKATRSAKRGGKKASGNMNTEAGAPPADESSEDEQPDDDVMG